MKDLPPWGKRAVSYVKVISLVFAALFAILAGALDLYAKYDDIKKKTESSYETLAPAVQELQKLFSEHVSNNEKWADGVDGELGELAETSAECEPLNVRLQTLEQTVERLTTRHRGVSVSPVDEGAEEDADASVEEAPAAAMPAPELASPQPAQKPARYVPDKIEQARDYQKKRQEKQCSPNDPLCGLE